MRRILQYHHCSADRSREQHETPAQNATLRTSIRGRFANVTLAADGSCAARSANEARGATPAT